MYHENQIHHRFVSVRSQLYLLGCLGVGPGSCREYFQRKDNIVSGDGDAKDVNAATHIIDPWPRYVGDRRIPANGDRMSRAVERYRQGSYRPPAPPIFPLFGGAIGITGRSGGGCRRRWRLAVAVAAAVGRPAADAEASHLRPGSILDDERGTG